MASRPAIDFAHWKSWLDMKTIYNIADSQSRSKSPPPFASIDILLSGTTLTPKLLLLKKKEEESLLNLINSSLSLAAVN